LCVWLFAMAGITLFYGGVTMTWPLVISITSIVSSVFFFLVNSRRAYERSGGGV
jgi:hypothetical protein